VVAAAIHCGLLPCERLPAYQEFAALPYYDRTRPEFIGTPYLMGRDEHGNEVYFMGLWDQRDKLIAAAGELLASAGVAPSAYHFQNAFPLITFSTKVGGLLSKRYRLTALGRRITVWGIKRRYPSFIAMVQAVKKRVMA
jgi:hypothetical protein